MTCSTIIPAAQPKRAWLSPVVLAAAIAAAGLLLPEEPQLQAESVSAHQQRQGLSGLVSLKRLGSWFGCESAPHHCRWTPECWMTRWA